MLAQPRGGRELDLVRGLMQRHPHAEVLGGDLHGLLGDEDRGGDEHQPTGLSGEGIELPEHACREEGEDACDLGGSCPTRGRSRFGGQGRDIDHAVEGFGVGLDPAHLVEDEHRARGQPSTDLVGSVLVEEERVDDEVLRGERVLLHLVDERLELTGGRRLRGGDDFPGRADGEPLVDDHRQPQSERAETTSSTVLRASRILPLSTPSIWTLKTR